MKNVLILGANGRVGSRLVKLFLEKDFFVTALVRDLENITLSHTNLEVIEIDLREKEKLNSLIQGKDIILSCLSGKKTKPDYSILRIPIFNLLEVIQTQRLIIVAGAGILDDEEYGIRRNRPNYPEIFKLVSAENWKIYEALKKTDVNWTLLCCPEMHEGEATEKFRIKKDYLPENGNRICTGDVALAIFSILNDETYFNSRVGIAH
jgi:uncharacterized protein